MRTNQRVEILIDELVLHGFSPADRHAIGNALTLELQQLVATGHAGELTGLKDMSSIRAGNISIKQDTKPTMIGTQIAGAVHGSLAAHGQRGVK
jgi:hypothetical protein